MKRIILLSAILTFPVLAETDFEKLSVMDAAALGDSRGMFFDNHEQDNTTVQAGVAGDVTNSITGRNNISPGAFQGANGIMLINLTSGNSNVTNMSASVNVIMAK
ncbi:hypothetical protein PU634_00195 [Oceanimonas pelagia]|uniref:Carbon storage regulator n=1 Tax=Oceanimonas pelagia TaxID=3028314 RepID=A0AA50KNR5_9GAMM|nr:hypothetical protein [Oceanimonas pelagia]WMC10819.1 hypothetical protein PU634_00195 [Oceanimonas pelagia]